MNDTYMTIAGNVVDVPRLRRTRNGTMVASFRVASTPRHYDREQKVFVDAQTLFVTVTCWRALAENVTESLRRGQPVIAYGRYCQREFEREETLRTSYELEASAVGHDLTRGVAEFRKLTRSSIVTTVDVGPDGMPADETAHYLDLARDLDGTDAEPVDPGELGDPDDVPVGVDPHTGELLELQPAG